MSDRVAELEAKVAELSETLGKVQSRLAVLERTLTAVRRDVEQASLEQLAHPDEVWRPPPDAKGPAR